MNELLFIQLPPPRFSFEKPPTNIPLAAGFLMAALGARGMRGVAYEALPTEISDVYADAGLAAAVASRSPAIVAMTLYVWNVERSLFLASNIKRYAPETRIVIGGPEVTPDNRWVLRHPAVEAGVFGEGELPIVPLIEALLSGRPLEQMPGVFFRADGEIRTNPRAPGPWNLGSCPYPYLDGKIGPSTDGTIFLETVRGCPFKCRYCYYHKAFQGVRFHPPEAIERVLDFAYGAASVVREIYLMDPTFNARKGFREILRSMARRRAKRDIAVHTEVRADLLSPDDVGLLKDAGIRSAELGLQTTNNAALREAGRQGDVEKIARGANLLKEAGIEVTTGIILGLPHETPSSFSATLKWLQRTEAYSVVHPFVLSVLPGTDFRARASELGLKYDSRPPYYVHATSTFPQEALQGALLECEEVFDMELDYIAPPSLVDSGPDVVTAPDQAQYISKWIVLRPDGSSNMRKRSWEVAQKATDPFTLWFRGSGPNAAEAEMLEILRGFSLANPHAVLNIVLELSDLPFPDFFQKALDVAADPGLFINRSYQPLYGEAELVSPSFIVIARDPGSGSNRDRVSEQVAGRATVVWEWKELDPKLLKDSTAPLLISAPLTELTQGLDEILSALEQAHQDHPDEVLFRDPLLQQIWDHRTRCLDPAYLFRERILVTG